MKRITGKKAAGIAGAGIVLGIVFLALCVAALFGGLSASQASYGSGTGGGIDEPYSDIVMQYAQEFEVEAALIFAVIKAESGFNPDAVSPVGARGLMQMMPSTFDGMKRSYFPEDPYTAEDLFDPEVSIKYGTKYLALMLEKYQQIEAVIASYNAGSGNVDRWLRDPRYSSGGELHTIPFPETKAYVKIVMDYYEDYTRQIQMGGIGGTGTGDLTHNLHQVPGKTNVGLVNFAYNALNAKSAYIYGAYGQTVTLEFLQQQAELFAGNTYANLTPSEVAKIYSKHAGNPSFDCIGLIKAYWWLDEETGEITYGSNGAADMGANAACNTYAVRSGSIQTIPEIIGLAVWQPGHIGIYVGNGEVIEAQGNSTGVVKTKIAGSRWTKWLQLPYMEYITSGTYIINGKPMNLG